MLSGHLVMASTLLLLPYLSCLLDGLFTLKTHFEYYLFQEAFSVIIKKNGLLQSLSSHIIGFISPLQLFIILLPLEKVKTWKKAPCSIRLLKKKKRETRKGEREGGSNLNSESQAIHLLK